MENWTFCEETSTDRFPSDQGSLTWILALVMALTMVATLVFNVIVIARMSWKSKHKFFTKYFIVSLACVDILVGATVMSFNLYGTFYDNRALLGELSCEISAGMDVTFTTSSILHLLVLTFDRYTAVCHPFTYVRWSNRKPVPIMVLIQIFCFVFPASISFPVFLLKAHIHGIERIYECQMIVQRRCVVLSNTHYNILGSTICFYVPAIATVCCNVQIYRTVRRKRARLDNRRQYQHSVHKKETRVARTIGTLMGMFLLCWLPFFILNIVVPFLDYHVDTRLNWSVTWLGYMNSAVNPISFLFMERRFSTAV